MAVGGVSTVSFSITQSVSEFESIVCTPTCPTSQLLIPGPKWHVQRITLTRLHRCKQHAESHSAEPPRRPAAAAAVTFRARCKLHVSLQIWSSTALGCRCGPVARCSHAAQRQAGPGGRLEVALRLPRVDSWVVTKLSAFCHLREKQRTFPPQSIVLYLSTVLVDTQHFFCPFLFFRCGLYCQYQ